MTLTSSPAPARVIGIAARVTLVALLLTGCGHGAPARTGSGARGGCVPVVRVDPSVASPGDTVTVVVLGGCRRVAPPGGWVIVVESVGTPDSAVRAMADGDTGEGFSTEFVLPADFPRGSAFGGIELRGPSDCTDSGSCPSPTGDFSVVGGPGDTDAPESSGAPESRGAPESGDAP